jgi:hypothetical protein
MNIMTEVVSAERLTNTASGNPRWRVVTRTGAWRTKDDAQVGHTYFDNLAHRKAKVNLEINGQGRIVGCEVL